MKTIFSLVNPARVKKSTFDLSHENKLTCNMGELVPVLVQEVLPGDKFTIDSQSLIRFAPLVAPVMHRINAYFHFFYVPNRIIWNNWEKFITGEDTVTVPKLDLCGYDHVFTEGSLADYMGIPTGYHYSGVPENINMLPFRAYAKIYNDYYRDENLVAEIDLENADETLLLLTKPYKRAWEKDYFTSALPWAQKGDPVTVNANVDYLDGSLVKSTAGVDVTGALSAGTGKLYSGATESRIENLDGVTVNVEDIRLAQRLQRFLERNARAGTRYIEHLLAHWGVVSSDARLQRAEYIGGGKSPVVVSEVLSHTGIQPEVGNVDQLPLGAMAGHGLNVGRTNQAYKFVEEHGYIIGIMSIMPEPGYNQGLHRMFSRMTQLDFAFPEFAQLGEQEVKNKELAFDGSYNSAYRDTAFGYQQRYAEYKFNQSSVHGEFRNGLEYWHLDRILQPPFALNQTFIECDPDKRIFAYEDGKTTLYVQIYHRIKAVRPLPYYNEPQF